MVTGRAGTSVSGAGESQPHSKEKHELPKSKMFLSIPDDREKGGLVPVRRWANQDRQNHGR